MTSRTVRPILWKPTGIGSKSPLGLCTSQETSSSVQLDVSLNGIERSLSSQRSCDSDSDSDYGEDGHINIGPDHQAKLPECRPFSTDLCPYETKDSNPDTRPVCLWAPPPDKNLPEPAVQEYCEVARSRYNFDLEQALALLLYNNYNIERAIEDLKNYRALPNEWTKRDRILFEQAFSFNGKNFRRIKQMMPDKSVQELVEHYYSQKKKRQRQSSYAENIYRKRKASWEAKIGGGYGENGDDDYQEDLNLESCANCHAKSAKLEDTSTGRLCGACIIRRKHGGKTVDKKVPPDSSLPQKGAAADADESQVASRPDRVHNAPPELNLDIVQFVEAACISNETGVSNSERRAAERQANLKKLEESMLAARAKACQNKSEIAQVGPPTVLRGGKPLKMCDISYLKVPMSQQKRRILPKWSAYEILLTLQGFRRYGKDLSAIADVVGTKNARHVRSFYQNHKEKYKLEELITDFEKEKEAISSGKRQKPAPEVIDLDISL